MNSDFKFNKNKSPSAISHTGVVAMAETELVEKSEVTISPSACKHNFGFLSKRAKGAAMPEECFTCEKMLDCMISKTKVTPSDAETEQTSEEQEREEQGKEVAEITEKTIPVTSELERSLSTRSRSKSRNLSPYPQNSSKNPSRSKRSRKPQLKIDPKPLASTCQRCRR